MKLRKPGSNLADYSYYKDSECPLTTFTDTHLIRLRPPTSSNSTNSIQKTHQKNGENIIISNIKRTMTNFVKAITNLTPHRGPKGAYFTLVDSRGDDSDTSKPKPQTDSKFSTNNQT